MTNHVLARLEEGNDEALQQYPIVFPDHTSFLEMNGRKVELCDYGDTGILATSLATTLFLRLSLQLDSTISVQLFEGEAGTMDSFIDPIVLNHSSKNIADVNIPTQSTLIITGTFMDTETNEQYFLPIIKIPASEILGTRNALIEEGIPGHIIYTGDNHYLLVERALPLAIDPTKQDITTMLIERLELTEYAEQANYIRVSKGTDFQDPPKVLLSIF